MDGIRSGRYGSVVGSLMHSEMHLLIARIKPLGADDDVTPSGGVDVHGYDFRGGVLCIDGRFWSEFIEDALLAVVPFESEGTNRGVGIVEESQFRQPAFLSDRSRVVFENVFVS